MKQIPFFATKDDLVPVLESVELKSPMKYVLAGVFPSIELESYGCWFEIPNLGQATNEQWTGCDTYLVCAQCLVVDVRPIDLYTGERRYAIDQLCNADTVTFTAGGLWKDDVLLNGRVATVSDTADAQSLMRRFHSAIKKTFGKIRAYYVGPNAELMLDGGKRLTGALQSPPDYDLRRN